MIQYSLMTNEELLAYLYAQGSLTEIELTLVERLTRALDEVEALSIDLGLKQ